jgi:putative transposase
MIWIFFTTPEVLNIHPTLAPAYVVKDIKLATHELITQNKKSFPDFHKWQVGYGSFTYHISAKHNLIKYVENQREHHKIVTFKQELIDLLKEHSVDYDENYLIT